MMLPRSIARLPVLALVAFLGAPLAALEEADEGERPIKEPSAEEISATITRLERAESTVDRARARRDLVAIGAPALGVVRARIAALEPGASRAILEQAAVSLLARKLAPTIAERVSTGLYFDGQYDDFKDAGPETVPALLSIVEDEAVGDGLRRGALNALADLASPDLLPRLRQLESDVLLDPALREELATLLAILGDTRKIDRKIREVSERIGHPDPDEFVRANSELAHLFYKIRKYSSATECYERILDLFGRFESLPTFQPTADFFKRKALHHYNAACSYSLAGELDKARDNLRKAIEIDPSHFNNMERDGDLRGVRESDAYDEFVRELRTLLEERSI